MKILIQSKDRNIFVRSVGTWTGDPDQARQFPDTITAMEFCARHSLHHVRILLKFGSERFDVPLEPRCFPWMQADQVRDRSNPNAAGQ